MKKALIFCGAVLLMSLTLTFAQGQLKPPANNVGEWTGEYNYSHSEGENAGGASILIEYKITVSKKGNNLTARFTVDGYQSSDDYECRAEAIGDKLNLYVTRDLADRGGVEMANAVKAGQLLASLIKTTARGKTVYQFKNGKYEIYPAKLAAKYLVYFKRK